MDELWERIERWLSDNAPQVLEDLNPGANDEDFSSVEETIGMSMPEEARRVYRVHNGQAGWGPPLLGSWGLLSLDDIASEWELQKELFDEGEFTDTTVRAEGPIQDVWWVPEWIPIFHNGAGDFYCLDLAPTESGTKGQVISVWHADERREVVASGFRTLLEQFAEDLESSRYLVENGELVPK